MLGDVATEGVHLFSGEATDGTRALFENVHLELLQGLSLGAPGLRIGRPLVFFLVSLRAGSLSVNR